MESSDKEHFEDALGATMKAIGYMRGVLDDYNWDKIEPLFDDNEDYAENLIPGLSNIILTLLDDISQTTGRTQEEVLDSLTLRINSAT